MTLNATPHHSNVTWDMDRRTDSLRVLVTAGPTREYFDSVRFITNASTGRQGYTIAECARSRGHDVILVSGPVAIAAPAHLKIAHVESAEEMLQICLALFDECDAAVMSAAVCDYRPEARSTLKLKKESQPRTVTLLPTEDICATLGRRKRKQTLIGFAMDDHDALTRARDKMLRKNCDYIISNSPKNLGQEQILAEILDRKFESSGCQDLSKPQLAARIVDLIEQNHR